MSSPACKHEHLILLPKPGKKLRCIHCHLTINEKELADGFCPECYEVSGMKRLDFEPLEPVEERTIRYRCENCGAIIEG